MPWFTYCCRAPAIWLTCALLVAACSAPSPAAPASGEIVVFAASSLTDAFQDTADLYLLLDIDVPWVDDGTRFFGDEDRRRLFFDNRREFAFRHTLMFF